MYNLRSRGRLVPAGSARPHKGMEVRAPPAVASQVTPSHALAVWDTLKVPETELFEADDGLSSYSHPLTSEDSLNDETLPPPNFSPVVETPQEFVADKIGSEYTKTTHKPHLPDPILGPDYPKPTHNGIGLYARSYTRRRSTRHKQKQANIKAVLP